MFGKRQFPPSNLRHATEALIIYLRRSHTWDENNMFDRAEKKFLQNQYFNAIEDVVRDKHKIEQSLRLAGYDA